jgi:indole-3-glycerol phosphate synthase
MILDEIIEKKKERLKFLKKQQPIDNIKEEALRMAVEPSDFNFYKALSKEGLSIIGEVKNASPSTGPLSVQLNVKDRIKQYETSVDAISILTEEDYFAGNIDIFKRIRSITKTPLLRKDFIIDSYQIYESKCIGADAILLIATALNVEDLMTYYELATALGLDVLLEVHDEKDLEKALQTRAKIIGVNNRNLKTFVIDLETTKRLKPLVPKDRLTISESGVATNEDIEFLKTCSIDGILVGKTLMETDAPKKLAKEWKEIYGT